MIHKNIFLDALLSFTIFLFISALLRFLFDGGDFVAKLFEVLPIAIGFVIITSLIKFIVRR
ncbi:hypothetical protein [Alkalicoccobacillus murimartini]|uniref:Uncharacterized protein n=1 Tax=Alkalicoccobacillus murimartini TaxID=171685 RepID=A0ABT9YE46_9BACI|nr:hypothetical protein [Alkalicoccobacillus murimartini]MDQ0205816.1 hypothetical protein [Alkalicoccobacillus murimartini]